MNMNIFSPPKMVEYLPNQIYSDQYIRIYLNTELFVTHCGVVEQLPAMTVHMRVAWPQHIYHYTNQIAYPIGK